MAGERRSLGASGREEDLMPDTRLMERRDDTKASAPRVSATRAAPAVLEARGPTKVYGGPPAAPGTPPLLMSGRAVTTAGSPASWGRPVGGRRPLCTLATPNAS